MTDQPARLRRVLDHVTFTVVHTRVDHADVVAPVGHLDIATAPRLITYAADIIRRGAGRVILDLQGVDFVDSAGLAALINLLRRVTAADGALVLVGTRPQVDRVLHATRLDREFSFAGTVEQGEQALAA